MKIWKLVPKHTRYDDPIWRMLSIPRQARMKAVSYILVRARSEESARDITETEFLSLESIIQPHNQSIIELSESSFMSKEYADCSIVDEDIAIDEQILAIKYRENSGFEDEVFLS